MHFLKHILIIIAMFFMYIPNIKAQQQINDDSLRISGIVEDEDKTPFEDVWVTLWDKETAIATTKTKFNGSFSFTIKTPTESGHELVVQAESSGYLNSKVKINSMPPNRKIRMLIQLKNQLWQNGYPH